MVMKRGIACWAATLLAGSVLAGCATTGDDGGVAANDQPGQIAPVTDSAVSSGTLPPIGGADGSVQVANADPDQVPPTNRPGMPSVAAEAALTTGSSNAAAPPPQVANANAFVSLNDVGKVQSGTGRDLTGALTVEKLLGGWTITSGAQQCRLNLTYTGAGTEGRYRASAPACQIPTLGSVSSWQLAGTQVQLFNDAGSLIGALLLAGDKFVGTLAGGQSISMVG
jgi:hypothetical protein